MKFNRSIINQIEINHFTYIPQKGIYLRKNVDVPIRTKKSREKPSIWNSSFELVIGSIGLIIGSIFITELLATLFGFSSLWLYGVLIFLIVGRSFLKSFFVSGMISITNKEIQILSKSIWGFQKIENIPLLSSKTLKLNVKNQSDGFLVKMIHPSGNIKFHLTDKNDLIPLIDGLSDLFKMKIETTTQNEDGEEVLHFH